MRTVLVHKYQRLGWCRAATSIAVLAVFGVFSSGHCFAQAAAREPGSERDRAVIHVDMGNADITRGDTRAALQNYFAAQRLFERLLSEEPQDLERQRDLSVLQERIGDVFVAQGKLPDAFASYKDSHVIADRLATSDPTNSEWQNDLSVAEERIGDVLVAQGSLGEALLRYRASHAI